MARDYARQRERLARLRAASRLVTASAYMREEYLRHGFPPDRLVHLALPVPDPPPDTVAPPALPSRLLWVGRMEPLKGGHLALDAAALAATGLSRTLDLTLVGDGRARSAWERRARGLAAAGAGVRYAFAGWLSAADLEAAFAKADLLVLSSLWPEPYGRVGLEAGRHGVPVAGFNVGGVSEWLTDGVNGHLAPGSPPRVAGLASAIVASLRQPADHARLREGARRVAGAAGFARHVGALERLFAEIRAHE
jgi:glycosyltransferase involved in cell wall biosynthesis